MVDGISDYKNQERENGKITNDVSDQCFCSVNHTTIHPSPTSPAPPRHLSGVAELPPQRDRDH
jgi:hypothetical protein